MSSEILRLDDSVGDDSTNAIEHTTSDVAKHLLATVVDPKVRQITARKLQGRWPLMKMIQRLIRCLMFDENKKILTDSEPDCQQL